jgi:glutamyl-tRNA reductase
MFFIDIAVPRDIDPAVNDLPDAYCYDIDDLNQAIDANRREREAEARKAQRIIEEEVERFERWFESLSAVPTIKALRDAFHRAGEQELDKTLAQLAELSPREAHQVRRMVHGLINKLLHAPSTQLKSLSEQGNGTLYAEAIAQLFSLRPSPGGAEGPVRPERGGADGGEADETSVSNVLRLPLP